MEELRNNNPNVQLKNIDEVIPVYSVVVLNGETTLYTSFKYLPFVMTVLKMHIGYQFSILSCISAVDTLNGSYRFIVVYDLLSITFSNRIKVKLGVNEATISYSLFNIFNNCAWWEREIWDMYGILFNRNLDMRRILTDYGFEGHPLRKDFPLSGYIEARYDASKGKVVLKEVQIQQEFRNFSQNATAYI